MRVLRRLRRNPVLFVPVLAWTVVQAPEWGLREVSPLLASVLSQGRIALLVLVTPFVHAGLVGMADEALDGETSLRTFLREGRSHYLPVLAVYLLVLAVNSVLGPVVLLLVLFGGLLFLGGDQPNLVPLAVVGVVVAIILSGCLIGLVFFQFYAHAIVIDGTGAVDGLKRSAALVRGHLRSALRYSVVGGLVGVLFGVGVLFSYAAVASRGPAPFGLPLPWPSEAEAAVGVVAVASIETLVGGAFTLYSVAFYHAISDDDSTVPGGTTP